MKDKNGVGIFEGDIIRVLYPMSQEKTNECRYQKWGVWLGEVVKQGKEFAIQQYHMDTPKLEADSTYEIEVLGNIHANKALVYRYGLSWQEDKTATLLNDIELHEIPF